MTRTLPISIVIPTYNGKRQLQKNLSSVTAQLKKNDELCLVDDASSDNTLQYLSKKFHLKYEALGGDKFGSFELYTGSLPNQAQIKVIVNLNNLRFAASVNRAVEQIKHDYFLLINNDVELLTGAVTQLLQNFTKNESLFAVGCLEIEPNQDNIFGGKNRLFFEKGLFRHNRAEDFTTGETAWASGGSAMFDRAKWIKLNGFDPDFYPAYWEDVDLSYRAKQQGWHVLFDQDAKVIHNHESTNLDVFGQKELEKISWRNGRRFTKKHATFKQKLQYYWYKPYWNLKLLKQGLHSQEILALIAILFLATVLRLYQLGIVPAGMTWDEAAIGYNGYGVIQTRRDEWLQKLPVSFKSFGDYKAPAAIYINGLFTSIFGLNLTIVRLPFALCGVLAVWGLIKFTYELALIHFPRNVKGKGLTARDLSLLAGFMLAVSPWHLHLSRTGFESSMALTFIIWGFYFLLLFIKNLSRLTLTQLLQYLIPAVVLLVLPLYTYHSPKIFIPVFIIIFALIHLNLIKRKLINIAVGIFMGIMLLLPLIKDAVFSEGLTRSGSLILFQNNSLTGIIALLGKNLLAHLSPAFLVGGWTDSLRHGAGTYGVLYLLTFLFCLISILVSLNKKIFRNYWLKLSLVWIFLGLLPAVLGDTYPQANRALLALPGFIWLSFIGLNWLILKLAHKTSPFQLSKTTIFIILGLIYLANIGAYLTHYYHTFAFQSASDYQEGYIDAMQLAYEYEKGTNGKPEVNQIIVSTHYGQPYIYALFVRKTNPIWYQGGSLNKYFFVDQVKESDLLKDNILVISTVEQLVSRQPDHIIHSTGGLTRFKVYYTGYHHDN